MRRCSHLLAARRMPCDAFAALEQRHHSEGHGKAEKTPVHGGALRAHMHVHHEGTGERAALGTSMHTQTRRVQPVGPAIYLFAHLPPALTTRYAFARAPRLMDIAPHTFPRCTGACCPVSAGVTCAFVTPDILCWRPHLDTQSFAEAYQR